MPQTRRRDADRRRANSETTAEVAPVAPLPQPLAPPPVAAPQPANEVQNPTAGATGKPPGDLVEEITDGCCCPSGCIVCEPIDPQDPDDAVPVICSSPDCTAGQFMHHVCFENWEQSVLTHVRLSGRARNWSEKQMVQNLWTKKGFDVAYKACSCKCGHGHLRKDLDSQVAKLTPVDDESKKRRNRKRSGGKQVPASYVNGGNGAGPTSNVGSTAPRTRSRTLSLGSSTALGYPPPDNQPGSQQSAFSPGAAPKKSGSNLDFFSDSQVQNTGSIFQRRETMASFYEVLPPWKVNGIHIKMEDDCPQGNDEARIFLLTSFGDHKMRTVPCVLCKKELAIYDKYPLVDGTFFMSPFNHGEIGVKVRHDTRDGYLFALCVCCLEHSQQFRCTRCGSSRWFMGNCLILGTLYSYDVLASIPCCQPVCKSCKNPLPMPSAHYFSYYSESTTCPACGCNDSHFIRQLDNVERSSA